MSKTMTECCANCKHLLAYPKNNSYGDVDYLCPVTSYFVANRFADRNKVKRYSPGGKLLPCDYKPNNISEAE